MEKQARVKHLQFTIQQDKKVNSRSISSTMVQRMVQQSNEPLTCEAGDIRDRCRNDQIEEEVAKIVRQSSHRQTKVSESSKAYKLILGYIICRLGLEKQQRGCAISGMTVDEFEKAEVDEETDNTVVVIAEHKNAAQQTRQPIWSGPLRRLN